MHLAEMVEPAAPQLGADARRVRLELGEAFELVFSLVEGAEIAAVDQVGQRALLDDSGAVDRVKLAVEARGADLVAHRCHIGVVLAEGTVFVLNLGHQDGTAPVDFQMPDLGTQAFQPAA